MKQDNRSTRPARHKPEIGLQLFSLRKELATDVRKTLEMVSDWGIKHLEGGGTYGLSIHEAKEELLRNDLRLVSVGVEFEQIRDFPELTASQLKMFDPQYAVCFSIPQEGERFTRKDADAAIDVLENAGRFFLEHGISLCYHSEGFDLVTHQKNNETLFDYIVKNTSPKYVSLELDVFWFKLRGYEPLHVLQKYGDRVMLLHLKDGILLGEQKGESVVLGTGDVGIASLVPELMKSNVRYLFLEDESDNPVSRLPQSLAFIERMLNDFQ